MRGIRGMMLLCIAGTLLASGCASPLYNAVQRNNIDVVKELLDKGADINERNRATICYTALIAASYAGRVDIVKLLLDRGADVNLESQDWTALGWAAWKGETDIARLLVERGADIDKAIAGLRRKYLTRDAVELLNEIKRRQPTPAKEPDAAPVALPTALPPPRESGATF